MGLVEIFQFQVSDVDSTNINFLIFHEPTTFDITGYVQIPDEFILSTKVRNLFNRYVGLMLAILVSKESMFRQKSKMEQSVIIC